MDLITGIILASALGSVSGLRMTATPLVMSLGANTPFFDLPQTMQWLSSPEMIGIWFLLNFVEFGAFSIPIAATGFDVAALGIAPLSSAFLVNWAVPEVDFMTALVFAGAPSLGVQLVTSGVRAVSGPFAPIVSAFESVTAFIAGLLAVVLPILTLVFMVWLVVWGVKRAKRFVAAKRAQREAAPPLIG